MADFTGLQCDCDGANQPIAVRDGLTYQRRHPLIKILTDVISFQDDISIEASAPRDLHNRCRDWHHQRHGDL